MERERDWELLCIYAVMCEAVSVLRATTASTSHSVSTELEMNARTQISSYLSRLSHHQSQRISVLEILYSLIFAEKKGSVVGADKYIATAAFVKWTLSLLQSLIEEEFERDYVRQSLKMKADVKQQKYAGATEEQLQALEARANRLQLMVLECALRLRVAELALFSAEKPPVLPLVKSVAGSSALSFIQVFLMPADALAQLCLRHGDVLQLRQVLSSFKTTLRYSTKRSTRSCS